MQVTAKTWALHPVIARPLRLQQLLEQQKVMGDILSPLCFFFFQGPAVSQKSILDTQTEFGYFEERIETRIHVVSEAVRVYI